MIKEPSKAYEPTQYEDEIYQRWEESGFFNPDNCIAEGITDKNSPSYAISMPPPNVTGTLHTGHASMLAVEDILTRYHRMLGDRTLWLPGADHAAIATQTKVEKIIKEEGTDRHQLGREKFLARVREFASQSHDTIVNQIKKLGSSCDWSREAYTLDEVRSRTVNSVFKMMYDDGLIYQGDRVVNWCPRCHSTLADDEVEYKNQTAKIYTFKYSKDFPFTIATTRPETKLGDTAVAVNPSDQRYKDYIGKTFKVNFVGVDLSITIIANRGVEMEFGTGALGVTPAHSLVDWQMAQENNLPIVKVINEDGFIHQGFGDYSGKTVLEARQLVADRLRAEGLLEKEEELENNLSLCYRCDTPIEPLPSLQWFIDVNKQIPKYGQSIKELSIAAVAKGVFGREPIKIVPERFTKNYYHWMENLRDWCISRQILFGHRVPVWHKEGQKQAGIEPPADENWLQDEATLDTWFSSGLWTFSTLANSPEQIKIKDGRLVIDSNDFRDYHPTSVLETGYDILFFWVARMIIMTTYAVADIPFRDVYLHGLVLDEKGKKMSKSKGNAIDPLEMISRFGADALRLSLVSGSTPGNDMNLSQEKIAGNRNLINKLWNIARFVSSSVDQDQANILNKDDLSLVDQWLLAKMEQLIQKIRHNIESYEFSQAIDNLRSFTWDDLADWYLEASKFEKNQSKSMILKLVLGDLLKLWHPFAPFVTEALWQASGQKSLLLVEKFPFSESYRQILKEEEEESFSFSLIQEIIILIRNARAENKIDPAKKIKAIIYAGSNKELLESQLILIKSLRTGIDGLTIVERGEKIEGEIFITSKDIEIYLIGAVDQAKERERVAKEIGRLEKIVKNQEVKLNNEEFTVKAPAMVIEKEKEKLAEAKSELKKLQRNKTN